MDYEFLCKFILHKENVIKKIKPQWKIVLHPITYYKKYYTLKTLYIYSCAFYTISYKCTIHINA